MNKFEDRLKDWSTWYDNNAERWRGVEKHIEFHAKALEGVMELFLEIALEMRTMRGEQHPALEEMIRNGLGRVTSRSGE